MLKELITLTESPLGQKAAKACVGAGEEDLAQLVTQSDGSGGDGGDIITTAVASGVQNWDQKVGRGFRGLK